MSIGTFWRGPYNGASIPDPTNATGGDGTVPGGNTGSLSIFALSSGTAIWHDDTRFNGTKSIRFTNTAGNAAFGRSALPSSTYTPGIEFDFECPAAADASNSPITIASLRNGAGTIQVRVTSALVMDLLTGGSGSQISAAVPTKVGGGNMLALTPGQTYRVGVYSTGSSSTNGVSTVRMRVWAFGADKATYLGDTSTTTAAVGTNPFTAVDAGIFQYGSVKSIVITNLRVDDAASDFMGPLVASNQAPTVTLPAFQAIAPSTPVTITAVASDPDGTIASYAWSLLSPSSSGVTLSGTTSSVNFTTGAVGSLYIIQCTVTDNGGAISSATTEVRVLSDQDALPLPNNASTGFVRTGSTSDGAALSDGDNTTFLTTPLAVSATPQTCRVRLIPVKTRNGWVVTATLKKDGTASCTALIGLQQGSVDKGSLPSIALTETWTDYTLTLSSAQVAAITDWGNLWGLVTFTS